MQSQVAVIVDGRTFHDAVLSVIETYSSSTSQNNPFRNCSCRIYIDA